MRRNSGAPKLETAMNAVTTAMFGVDDMWSLNMHGLLHWFAANGSVLAIVVTAGVAVLLVCCLGCSNCPRREKDELFRRRLI
jgi:hypothetical protein